MHMDPRAYEKTKGKLPGERHVKIWKIQKIYARNANQVVLGLHY